MSAARKKQADTDSTPKVRLHTYALAALTAHPKNYIAAQESFFSAVRKDVEVTWEMIAPFRTLISGRWLASASAELRKKGLPGQPKVVAGSGARSDQNSGETLRRSARTRANLSAMNAVAAVAQKSLLDTFIVNGKPIGDLTPEEAHGWAGARERDARFVRMLASNLPRGELIRKYRTAADTQQIYTRAQEMSDAE